MNWKRLDVGGLRKIGPAIGKPGHVELMVIAKAGPGDIDVSQSQIFRAEHRGHSYVVAFDGLHPSRGWSATVKALGGRKASRDPEELIDGAATREEAEAACLKHARTRLS